MLSGKVAIITGAGRGLEREEALTMAKEGWKENGRYIIQVRTENAVVINDAYAIVD
jgi:NAD(P)-dependent dehydrogenase (short-subunit alcohol dehydrogenase family)